MNKSDDQQTGLVISVKVQVITYFLLLASAVVGIVGNILITYVICRSKFLRTHLNAYLVSLAIADLMVCVLLVPIRLVLYSDVTVGHDVISVLCSMDAFIKTSCEGAQLFMLVATSFERYQSIANPFEKQGRRRRTALITTCSWILAVVLGIVSVVHFGDGAMLYPCYQRTPVIFNSDWGTKEKIVTLPLGLLCLILVVSFYCLILHVLNEHSATMQKRFTKNKVKPAQESINAVSYKLDKKLKEPLTPVKVSKKQTSLAKLPDKDDMAVNDSGTKEHQTETGVNKQKRESIRTETKTLHPCNESNTTKQVLCQDTSCLYLPVPKEDETKSDAGNQASIPGKHVHFFSKSKDISLPFDYQQEVNKCDNQAPVDEGHLTEDDRLSPVLIVDGLPHKKPFRAGIINTNIEILSVVSEENEPSGGKASDDNLDASFIRVSRKAQNSYQTPNDSETVRPDKERTSGVELTIETRKKMFCLEKCSEVYLQEQRLPDSSQEAAHSETNAKPLCPSERSAISQDKGSRSPEKGSTSHRNDVLSLEQGATSPENNGLTEKSCLSSKGSDMSVGKSVVSPEHRAVTLHKKCGVGEVLREGSPVPTTSSQVDVVDMEGRVKRQRISIDTNHVVGAVCVMNTSNKVRGRRRVEMRAAKRIAVLIGTYTLMWLPLPLTVLGLSLMERSSAGAEAIMLTSAFSVTTVALNPTLNVLLNKQLRSNSITAMRNLMKRLRQQTQ